MVKKKQRSFYFIQIPQEGEGGFEEEERKGERCIIKLILALELHSPVSVSKISFSPITQIK
jgi:hypothetical protein